MKALFSVLTIVLTGEAVANFLAHNTGVLLLIIGILIMWYVAVHSLNDHIGQELNGSDHSSLNRKQP